MTDSPELSVVVPVKDGAEVLRRSLEALHRSELPRSRWELIVVDDGSADESPRVGAELADRVVEVPNGPRGPAAARNLGVQEARAPVVVFVDADVVVHPDTLEKFLELFRDRPDVSAAFGAYDAEPGHPDFLSQYRNLYHRYVHVRGAGEATTFWAGCGAVRRSAFLEVGMFDEGRFPRPQIEDIELGYRLRDHGHRIVLDPTIQATHLKRWTFAGMVRTDLLDRGMPWARLILERGKTGAPDTLNLRSGEKVRTALVGLSLVFLGIGAVAGGLLPFLGAALSAGAAVVMNLPTYRWFARARGWPFAVGVIPLNLLYYFISGVAVVLAWVGHVTGVGRAPGGAGEPVAPAPPPPSPGAGQPGAEA